jgi:hypothetical protein
MNTLMSRENGLGGRGGVRRAGLALTIALALVAIGCTGVASAMPAGEAGGSYHASEWAQAPASGDQASLSNDVGTPAGVNSELLLGLGLVGFGALALTFGLAVMRMAPRSPRPGIGAPEGIRRMPLRAAGTSNPS